MRTGAQLVSSIMVKAGCMFCHVGWLLCWLLCYIIQHHHELHCCLYSMSSLVQLNNVQADQAGHAAGGGVIGLTCEAWCMQLFLRCCLQPAHPSNKSYMLCDVHYRCRVQGHAVIAVQYY